MIHWSGLTKKVKKECCAQISVKRKKEDNQKFPKTLYKLEHLSVILFLSFLFLFILSYDNKQERAVMTNAAEILKSVQIGLNVVIFLLNTDRGLRATELCNECVILLQNLDSGSHLDISDILFNAYYAISGYTDAERRAVKLLDTFNHAWRLIFDLGDMYEAQSRFVEAKQLFKGALTIMKTIGHQRKKGLAYGRLGYVCTGLCEYQKAKEYFEKAIAIAIEIGDRRGEGTTYGNLGMCFISLANIRMLKNITRKHLPSR